MQTGTLLSNRYRIDAKLGEGGMGLVYRAHDTLLDRSVAIKTLTPAVFGEEGARRFVREAQSAARLNHPNVVSIYDAVEEGGQFAIVMELVEGQTLRELLPVSVERLIEITVQILRGLEYAHAQGIVHRDIKPENIIVTNDGSAKLMDFGLARSEGRSRLTQSGMLVGTVGYMAPEQALGGQVDGRSDLYALGAVLYVGVAGRPPFESEDPISVITQHINVPPVAPHWHNPATPPALESVILKLLAKDPADRPGSAAAVAQALESLPTAKEAGPVPPAPSLVQALRRSPLVGREQELVALRAAVDRTIGGDGGVVFLVGEPGIGKTRLCQELSVYGRLRGCRVWTGQAYERETSLPYGPFAEALKVPLSDALTPSPDAAALPPDQRQARLFEQVSEALRRYAAEAPVLLILDDLHWGDASTLDLVRYLARSLRDTRLLIVGTYRDVEVGSQHPLIRILGDLNRERLYERVLVRRLDEEAAASLIAAGFNDEVAHELLGPIHRETEGNPFFIEEVLRDLVEAGALKRVDGGWMFDRTTSLRVPESIREAIGRRLDRLSDACRDALVAAAVIGREFTFDVLRAASSLDEDELVTIIDEALGAQIIREVKGLGGFDTYGFQHALIQDTLYDSLNPRRRARMHRQVGEAYERVHAKRLETGIEVLAYHFGRADAGQAPKGIRYNIQAADAASRVFAQEAAEARLRVAIELAEGLGDPMVLVDVLERLGDHQLRVQQGRPAAEAFSRALTTGERAGILEVERKRDLQLKVVEASAWYAGPHPEARRMAEQLASLSDATPALRVRALNRLAGLQQGAREYGDALATAQQALILAEQANDSWLLSRVQGTLWWILGETGEWEKAERAAAARLALVDRLDDIGEKWDAHSDMTVVELVACRYPEALRYAEQTMQLAKKMQSPLAVALTHHDLVWVYWAVGRWEESVRVGREGMVLGDRVGLGEGQLLLIALWSGLSAAYVSDEATARLHAEKAGQLRTTWSHIRSRTVQAWVLLALDDLDAAAEHIAAMPKEWPSCVWCQDICRFVNGQYYARTGAPEKAESVLREILRPGTWRRQWLEGEAYYGIGLAASARGDPNAAVEAFSAARDRLAEVGHVWTLAQSWQELGRAYAARGEEGDLQRSRESLAQARDLLLTHGAVRRAEQVAALPT